MDLSLAENCLSLQCFLPNLKSIDINSVFGLVVVLKLVHIHVHEAQTLELSHIEPLVVTGSPH